MTTKRQSGISFDFSFLRITRLSSTVGLILLLVLSLMLMRAEKAEAAAGALDSSFGTSGKIVTSFGSQRDVVGGMAIQSDGKIVVAGFGDGNNSISGKFALARYNPNGSLDTSFDGDGKVITVIGGVGDKAYDVAIQSDGKIVAAGGSYINGSSDFAVVRYNTDGSLDTTFDGDGKVTTTIRNDSDEAYNIAIQPDGKIVAAGGSFNFGPRDCAIVRYNTDGSLDTSFDGDGKVTTAFGTTLDQFRDVEIQPDGKIIAVGETWSILGKMYRGDWILGRYNPDGSLDTSFNGVGKVITSFTENPDSAQDVEIQSDGKYVVTGNIGAPGGFALARYNLNGTLDSSFDGDGKVVTNINSSSQAYTLAIQQDGKILAAGAASIGGNAEFALARYNANGSLDETFDNDGIATVSFGASNDVVQSISIQPDRRIVIAGYSTDGSDYDFAVARVLGNTKTVADFDGDGRTDLSIYRASEGQWWYKQSSNNVVNAYTFGISTDKITPGDYDGDGKTDVAFWRPSTGEWFILRSSNLTYYALPFGANGDIPAPGDFDGDGKDDYAVFRPSTGTWFIKYATGNISIHSFGSSSDIPQVADYDGDGKSDMAIFRPVGGSGQAEWWLNRSQAGFFATPFGTQTDKPVPMDYTGDGKADIAFWRPSDGNWFVLRSEGSGYYAAPFGADGDIPASGDYDGDGKYDFAVFRPSGATWFVMKSGGGVTAEAFGANGDKPVASAFVP